MIDLKKHLQLLIVVFLSFHYYGKSEVELNLDSIDGQVTNILDEKDSLDNFSNYSKVYLRMDESIPTDPLGPPLYIISNKDTVLTSDSILFNISLGDNQTLAKDIYGISMTLKHETVEIFGSDNSASFSGSWLGTEDVDMITLSIPLEDGIDLAMVRTDKINRTGQGYLSTVKVIIPDNLGETVKGIDLQLTDVFIYSYNGDTILPNVINGDSIVVYNTEDIGVNAEKTNTLENGLKVYPNPNSGMFTIESILKLDKIRISDLSVRLIRELSKPSQREVLNFAGLDKGVYIIEIQSGSLTAYKRVFVK
jgi:hypothetical protein